MSNKKKRIVLVLLVAVALIVTGAAVTMATDQDNDGVIYACINQGRGQLRIVDGCDACKKSERCLYWNRVGPEGPVGPSGECECPISLAEFEALKSRVAILEGQINDEDDDGYPTDEDCNDQDANINPGAPEICNDQLDNDCDSFVDCDDDDCLDDTDGDGFAALPCGGDCDDRNIAVNPAAIELCNDIDDNCSGQIDEGFDLSSDPENCGYCGCTCNPAANATIACIDGTCQISSCETGYIDCNADISDGCELGLAPWPPTSCDNALNLGTVSGDTGMDVQMLTDRGPGLFKFTMSEEDSSPLYVDLNAVIRLRDNPGNAYRITLYQPCGNEAGDWGDGIIQATVPDTLGDDSTLFFIQVDWVGKATCASWTLEVEGNVPH